MTSNFLKNPNDWTVCIPQTTERNGVTMFHIHMRIGRVKWSTERRYKEFSELHKSLVINHSVPKDILPPKVFFKKMTQEDIQRRKEGLEKYINSILRFLWNAMPPALVTFLELDKYDMWFLFGRLANCIRTNKWLESPPKEFRMSLIEVSTTINSCPF